MHKVYDEVILPDPRHNCHQTKPSYAETML